MDATSFLSAVSEAGVRGLDVPDLHPELSPVAADQASLSSFMRSLLERREFNDIVVAFVFQNSNTIMISFLKNALFSTFAIFSLTANAETVDSPPPIIGAVWNLSAQPCNGGGGNAMHRDSSEVTIKQSGVIELPSLKLKFKVPKLPYLEKTYIKTYLGDKSRGVVDNYILLADGDLSPPVAAVVITELPADFDTDKAFAAVDVLERQLNNGKPLSFEKIYGPYGEAVEFQLPNRGGTHCFPTARFQFIPADLNLESIGISRFIFKQGYLVEFALIVRIAPEMTLAERKVYAKKIMDGYWAGLSFI
jgi:hypothetical protein